MYYKNKENKPYFEPSQEIILRDGLEEITEEEFNQIVLDINTPTAEQELQAKLQEAQAYLNSTGWIWEKFSRNVVVLKDMTEEEFKLKYADIIAEQERNRLLINELELQLGAK